RRSCARNKRTCRRRRDHAVAQLSSGCHRARRALAFRRLVSSRTWILLHQVYIGSVPPSWWQSMDRSSPSTPLLALKSEIGAPPDFREIGTRSSAMAKAYYSTIFEQPADELDHRSRPQLCRDESPTCPPGTVDRGGPAGLVPW